MGVAQATGGAVNAGRKECSFQKRRCWFFSHFFPLLFLFLSLWIFLSNDKSHLGQRPQKKKNDRAIYMRLLQVKG